MRRKSELIKREERLCDGRRRKKNERGGMWVEGG